MRSAAALLLCMPRYKWTPMQSSGMTRQRVEHRKIYNDKHKHKRWHEKGRTGRRPDSEAPDDAPILRLTRNSCVRNATGQRERCPDMMRHLKPLHRSCRLIGDSTFVSHAFLCPDSDHIASEIQYWRCATDEKSRRLRSWSSGYDSSLPRMRAGFDSRRTHEFCFPPCLLPRTNLEEV